MNRTLRAIIPPKCRTFIPHYDERGRRVCRSCGHHEIYHRPMPVTFTGTLAQYRARRDGLLAAWGPEVVATFDQQATADQEEP